MKKSIRKYIVPSCAVVVAMAVSHVQVVRAGWTGAMNGEGFGQAGVNVTSALEKVRIVNTTNMVGPSASIKPTLNYAANGNLPEGSSKATVARVLGTNGYVWQATTVGSNGDSTDNAELESRITIKAADCAAVEIVTESQVAESGKSGTITVNALGTAGTALWLRGFEFTGDKNLIPLDDEGTSTNEFVEFLKAHGDLKWDVLMVGPFEFNSTNCTQITIPFTIDTDTNNLFFVSDAVAKSLPLVIVCPPDVTVKCDAQPAVYPPVQIAGCGDISISYYPPAGTTLPVGTNPITVTAVDKDDNTNTCTFNVIVTDTTPPVIPSLPTLTGEASVTVPVPMGATDNCGGTVSVSTTNSLSYNTQGTFTVYWDFDDGHGNTNTVPQSVIVDDVTAPAAPVLATVTGQCSASVAVPTATDNVVGSVMGTTSDPLTYNTQGTFIVHWTFDDGNENTSTATQTVIVKDTIAPVKPTLSALTFDACSGSPATPPTPTTTDNCAGTVTGTTTTEFPITAQGTTVVTWTFSDGHGNTTTANQNVTVTGLTFQGFYSPIGTVSNTCANGSAVVVNRGSVAPLKFDMFCGTTRITGGTAPTVTIVPVGSNCEPNGTARTFDAEYQNDWHYNWDTTGWARGTYKAIVNLPDGITKPYVFIKIK